MSLSRPLAGLVALSLALTTLTFAFRPEPAEAHHRCGHQDASCAPTSTTTTTTTSTSTATATWTGAKAAMRPVGSAPLSDAEAAARVHRSSWEPRPENYTPNHRVPTSAELSEFRSLNTAPSW
ncbi:MAG TPA: hypothetical protein VGR26_16880, partial [Acidimicrobiales bacterium]|nr:hypothetical protein [Acidimicrobiales bacterium]